MPTNALRAAKHDQSAAVDPVTAEIIGNALTGISNRITARMIRAAEALVIKEGEDCSSALFDRNGQLLAESHTVPLLRNAVGTCMRTILDKYFPVESWQPGDMVLTNDPYAGGESFSTAHSNDFCVIQPVFWQERLVAFVGFVVHHLDIGSANMAGQGWNQSIFQEGLRIPPMKIVEAGVLDRKIIDIVMTNSRIPAMIENDFTAQIACTGKAVPEVERLFEKYGEAAVQTSFDALIEKAEVMTRSEIARIPDGVYRHEVAIMDDGGHGGPYPLKVEIRKLGTDLVFDFTGTHDQVAGPINAPLSTVWGAVLFTMRCMMDPSIPASEGATRPIRIIAPPGTLVNARFPAAVWQRMMVCQSLIDLIMGAMAKASPERVIADSAGVQYNYVSSKPTTFGAALFFGKNELGGIGATARADGVSIVAPHLNNCPLPAAETYEVEYPVRFVCREVRADSGGPGRYRGGLGQILRYEILKPDLSLVFSSQKTAQPPQGRAGGKPGATARWIINEGTDREQEVTVSNGSHALEVGDVVSVYTPGGGGFGDPAERDPGHILADLRAGFVTPEGAERDYGFKAKGAQS